MSATYIYAGEDRKPTMPFIFVSIKECKVGIRDMPNKASLYMKDVITNSKEEALAFADELQQNSGNSIVIF